MQQCGLQSCRIIVCSINKDVNAVKNYRYFDDSVVL
jgi:hypothetical protein